MRNLTSEYVILFDDRNETSSINTPQLFIEKKGERKKRKNYELFLISITLILIILYALDVRETVAKIINIQGH
jgi:hypothetical protein